MVGWDEIFRTARFALEVICVQVSHCGDVVVLLASACGVVLPWCLFCGCAYESVVLHIEVRLVAVADAVVGIGA